MERAHRRHQGDPAARGALRVGARLEPRTGFDRSAWLSGAREPPSGRCAPRRGTCAAHLVGEAARAAWDATRAEARVLLDEGRASSPTGRAGRASPGPGRRSARRRRCRSSGSRAARDVARPSSAGMPSSTTAKAPAACTARASSITRAAAVCSSRPCTRIAAHAVDRLGRQPDVAHHRDLGRHDALDRPATSAPPSSFTAWAPPSFTRRTALRTASSGPTW